MALRINLYHEVLRTKKEQKYDPLKLSLYAAIIIAAGLIAWYCIELGKYSVANGAYQKKAQELAALKPKEAAAKQKQEEIEKSLGQADKLTKRIEDRFYWAPLVETIASVVPETVQMTKFSGDITGENLRKVQVNIEGIAAGLEPRAVAEDLRIALADRMKKFKNPDVSFKSLEDAAGTVTVNNEKLNTALFSIGITFNVGEEPPPPPPPKNQRGRKTVAQQTP